jgi:hypothetical protein
MMGFLNIFRRNRAEGMVIAIIGRELSHTGAQDLRRKIGIVLRRGGNEYDAAAIYLTDFLIADVERRKDEMTERLLFQHNSAH